MAKERDTMHDQWSYQCTVFSEHLKSVFGIDITNDVPDIHHLLFCYRCKRVIDKSVHDQHHRAPYKSSCSSGRPMTKKNVRCICVYMYMDIIIVTLYHPDMSSQE